MKTIKIIALTILGLFLLTSIGFADVLENDDKLLETEESGAYTAVEPVATPSSGTYTSTQSVTLSGATNIRYTTSGVEPTCTSGTAYSTPISVSSTTTIKAISCYLEGDGSYSRSNVSTFNYTIQTDNGGNGGGPGGGSPGGGTDNGGQDQEAAPPSGELEGETDTGEEDQDLPLSTNPSDYKTRNGCIGANFYWYDNACHSNPQATTEEDGTPLEGTKGYYQGQKEDLEEQLRKKKEEKGKIEILSGFVSLLINHVEGTEKEDDYKDALLAIINSIESIMGGVEGRIEELEDLLGIVREKISRFNQVERVETLERVVVRLLNAIEKTETNQTKIAALQSVLKKIGEIRESILAKL